MTLLYRDPAFLRHRTGHHPERPERLLAIEAMLHRTGLAARCASAPCIPLDPEKLRGVHDEAVFRRASHVAHSGGGMLDADTPICPDSVTVALLAAGTAVSAVDAVLAGKDHNALCLVRPPGHHATPTHSMGFCLFNNIAVAARHARSAHGLDRVLIVDWDVHHGNGTQDIFYADPAVAFLSIHRYGDGFYPGTGAANETGTGPGLGTKVNVPLRYGTPRFEFVNQFADKVAALADRVKPQLILVSAGFDAHHDDPVGDLGLEVEDFARLTKYLLAIANVHCAGRVVSCLEGGYDVEALADCVHAHLTALVEG